MSTPTLMQPAGSGPRGYKSWSRRKKILAWAGGVFLAMFVLGGIANAVSPPKPAPASNVAQSAPAAPAAPAAPEPAPVVTHTVTAAPKPAVTVTHTAAPAPAPTTAAPPAISNSEQQAIDAAQGYLSMGSGFSQESLLQQLTSSYGSGFSQADAQFAINYLNPNWDAQAVDAAKGYMQMGGFSAASLTQQLTSDAGNGFTEAQAEYAVAQVGL